jgi:hypothetical protein
MTVRDPDLDDPEIDGSPRDDSVEMQVDDGALVDPANVPIDDQLYDDDPPYDPEQGKAGRGRGIPLRQYLVGSVLFARLATAGLWVLVVSALFVALLALLAASRASDAPDVTATDDGAAFQGDAARAAGFAEMAVRRYVGEAGQGAEDVMAPLLNGQELDLEGVTPAGFYVVDATTVDLVDVGGGYWSATVALELMASVEGNYEPIGARYYGAGVILDDTGGAVLADLPSQVPAPPAAESPGLLADALEPPDDSPQIDAAQEFLGALLLGEGSMQRLTAPGSDIQPIDPPPFEALEIDGAAIAEPDADATAVRVSLLAIDENGLAQRLHYTLGMRRRAGRWEVADLFRAPLLSDESYPPPEDVPES